MILRKIDYVPLWEDPSLDQSFGIGNIIFKYTVHVESITWHIPPIEPHFHIFYYFMDEKGFLRKINKKSTGIQLNKVDYMETSDNIPITKTIRDHIVYLLDKKPVGPFSDARETNFQLLCAFWNNSKTHLNKRYIADENPENKLNYNNIPVVDEQNWLNLLNINEIILRNRNKKYL